METVDMRPAHVHDPLVDAQPVTALEALSDELGELVAGEVTLPVAARSGYSVVYSTAIDGARMAAMRRACRDDTQPDGIDQFRWSCTVLAAHCLAIVRAGQRIVDGHGDLVTFRSPELWSLLKVPTGSPSGASVAVKRLLGSDGAVQATFLALLAAAGWGQDVAAVDPTTAPSPSS